MTLPALCPLPAQLTAHSSQLTAWIVSDSGSTIETSNIHSNYRCVMAHISNIYTADRSEPAEHPLLAPVSVAAGFPSPSQDYFSPDSPDGRLNLNDHLIHDSTSTYVIRVSGHSMEGAGISDGDELIVNRALEPRDGNVIVAILDGELTIKRLRITPTGVVLQAENPDYPDIRVPELSSIQCWGVASVALHHLL